MAALVRGTEKISATLANGSSEKGRGRFMRGQILDEASRREQRLVHLRFENSEAQPIRRFPQRTLGVGHSSHPLRKSADKNYLTFPEIPDRPCPSSPPS